MAVQAETASSGKFLQYTGPPRKESSAVNCGSMSSKSTFYIYWFYKIWHFSVLSKHNLLQCSCTLCNLPRNGWQRISSSLPQWGHGPDTVQLPWYYLTKRKRLKLQLCKPRDCIHQELEATITYLLSDREEGSHRWHHWGECERQNNQKQQFCSNCWMKTTEILRHLSLQLLRVMISLSGWLRKHTDCELQWQPWAFPWCPRCKYKTDDLQKRIQMRITIANWK